VEGAARLLLGLMFAALVLSYLQHGPSGPRSWVRAKFLGEVK
jgi:hypothetical protein